jgi:hypothetical protein
MLKMRRDKYIVTPVHGHVSSGNNRGNNRGSNGFRRKSSSTTATSGAATRVRS